MWIGGAVDHLCTVEGERAGILGIRSLVGHHDAETPDLGVDDGPEGVKVSSIALDPPIQDVMRTDGVLDGVEWRDLVVLQDDLALRIEDEADVEEAVLDLGMARLRLGHDKGVIGASKLAKLVRLRPRNVDGAFARELDVIQVEHFVVEALQRALGKGDQLDGQIKAGEPGGGFNEVFQMLNIALNVGARANAAHGRDKANGGVGLNHTCCLSRCVHIVDCGEYSAHRTGSPVCGPSRARYRLRMLTALFSSRSITRRQSSLGQR